MFVTIYCEVSSKPPREIPQPAKAFFSLLTYFAVMVLHLCIAVIIPLNNFFEHSRHPSGLDVVVTVSITQMISQVMQSQRDAVGV